MKYTHSLKWASFKLWNWYFLKFQILKMKLWNRKIGPVYSSERNQNELNKAMKT